MIGGISSYRDSKKQFYIDYANKAKAKVCEPTTAKVLVTE
jgi:hypothetical protein